MGIWQFIQSIWKDLEGFWIVGIICWMGVGVNFVEKKIQSKRHSVPKEESRQDIQPIH